MNRPRVSVTLRIAGNALDVDEVTKILGCTPTDARRKGDEVRTAHFVKKAPTGVWRLLGECPDGDIDSAVTEVLGNVTSDPQRWARLCERLQVDLFCGIFLQSSNQGISLQPETLSELGARNIKLSFDIYACDDSFA